MCADPPRYRLITIEPPTGVTTVDSIADNFYMGLNNRGEVVGEQTADSLDRPFVWLPTRNANYVNAAPGSHLLPRQPDTRSFQPREVNVDGIAVGRVYSLTFGTSAYYWNLNDGTHDIIFLFDLDEHKDQATDINDEDPPVITGEAFVPNPPDIEIRAFRKVFGGAGTVLDPFLAADEFGLGRAISDAGFVAGYADLGPPDCGQTQNTYRTVTWPASGVTPFNLATLGTSSAEAFTEPLDVNNASPPMLCGRGNDPFDTSLPCRKRAPFWINASSAPIALPFLVVGGQPITNDFMEAHAVADPTNDGIIRVVGFSENLEAAVLWRRVNNVWEAIDLNTVTECGPQWANLSHAYDTNDCGWIVGHGTLTDGSIRAFVLVPRDVCPGDLVGDEVAIPDGRTDVNDLLYLIGKWGTADCVADLNADAAVNVTDLLALIGSWGACACHPEQEPVKPFSEELLDAELNSSKWSAYIDVLTNVTATQKENYNCWMQRHFTKCATCPACPGRNPFAE